MIPMEKIDRKNQTFLGFPLDLFGDSPLDNEETRAIEAWSDEETYQHWLDDGLPRDP